MATLRRLVLAQLVAYVKRLCDYRDNNTKDTVRYNIHYNILIMYIISLLLDMISIIYGEEIFSGVIPDKDGNVAVEMSRKRFNSYINRIYKLDRDSALAINRLFDVRNGIAHNFTYASKDYVSLLKNVDKEKCFLIYKAVLSKLNVTDEFKLNVYGLLKDMFIGPNPNDADPVNKLLEIEIAMLSNNVNNKLSADIGISQSNKSSVKINSSKSDIEDLLKSLTSK